MKRLPRTIKVYPGSVYGSVEAPPSKSYTHRAIFASYVAGGGTVERPLVSGDTLATVRAVKALGAEVELGGGMARLAPREPERVRCVDAGGSGTTIRIAMALAARLEGPTLLYGDESLMRRPVAPLSEALRRLGATVGDRGGRPPVAVAGPLKGRGPARIDGAISSQFVSALIFLSAAMPGLEVEVERVSSRGYLDITVEVLEWFGASVERRGYEWFRVTRGPRPARVRVPGDYSSASFMLAAGALAGSVTVKGLRPLDPQPDRRILDVLRLMGASVRVSGDSVTVSAPSEGLSPIDVNLDESPDLAPVVAVLAATARGQSVLRGLARLRYKESDRLEAIASNLTALGVRVRREGDTLYIDGGRIRGGQVDSHGDHRIAMAFAVAGLAASRPIVIKGFDRVSDSYPEFLDHLKSVGGVVEVVEP